MGVFNKIKNIFFEEEYVEVEEDKKPKKESKKEKTPAVAKKLDLPEIKKEKVIEEEEPKEEVIEPVVEEEPKEEEPKFKFPMVFEEDDFKEEPFVEKYQEPEEEKVVEKKCFDFQSDLRDIAKCYSIPSLLDNGKYYLHIEESRGDD